MHILLAYAGFGVQQPPPEMTTCLGDLYSVAWMENSEQSDMTHETLEQQYQLLKERTSANFTYISGSHVMQVCRIAGVTGCCYRMP